MIMRKQLFEALYYESAIILHFGGEGYTCFKMRLYSYLPDPERVMAYYLRNVRGLSVKEEQQTIRTPVTDVTEQTRGQISPSAQCKNKTITKRTASKIRSKRKQKK